MNNEIFNHKDIKDIYKETDYFDIINFKIKIRVNDPGKGSNVSYQLKNVQIDSSKYGGNKKLLEKIESGIDGLNSKIAAYKKNQKKEWNIFYLYKDIFQILSDEFNYYRGQATNWPMLPGVLRNNIAESFINDFEITYQDIMYKYPDIINYVPPVIDADKIILREQELAHLQHYGFQSSLIDITENPYISLLFMVSETSSAEFGNGVIDAFSIDLDAHKPNNLFSRVKLLESNKRIIAQKGAFLNFEKVVLNNLPTKIVKIPLVRITLDYDFPKLDSNKAALKKLRKKSEKLFREIEKIDIDKLSSEDRDKIKQLNKKYIKASKTRRELSELNYETNQLEKFYSKIFLNSIRGQINNKLEEFHYVENDLFPDFYKYISYIKSKYDSLDETAPMPDLKKGYDAQTEKNLKNILDSK